MHALVVYESSYGTTARIAHEVAAGLRAAGADVLVANAAETPDVDGFDLLVVGAPTHNLGLPGERSRAQAIARGAEPDPTTSAGVGEWLTGLPRLAVRAAAFDTVVASAFSGSAAKRIEKRLARLGATVVDRAEFVVAGSPPVLGDGELERAQRWGSGLAAAR